jgi:toxin ParE1/3/4
MAQVRKQASAKLDLVDHFVYLAENASLDTAERFLSCAESSFNDLATHPEMGLSCRSEAWSLPASGNGESRTSRTS